MPDWTYHPFLKPLLFALPPEDGRRLTMRAIELLGSQPAGRWLYQRFAYGRPPPDAAVEAFGLRFPSAVGMGPGIDIEGTTMGLMQQLGFGYLVLGPAGAASSLGRPSTHAVRVGGARAIAWSGRAGAPAAAEVARRRRAAEDLTLPVGLALRGDLAAALSAAGEGFDFFVLPPAAADSPALLQALRTISRRPLLLRLSPAWDAGRLDEVLDAAVAAGVDGAVAVAGEPTSLLPEGELVGPFLRDRTLEVIRAVVSRFGDRLPVIGAGGLSRPDDAVAYRAAGARLVEVDSGLVYAGPGLPGRIIRELDRSPAAAVVTEPALMRSGARLLPAYGAGGGAVAPAVTASSLSRVGSRMMELEGLGLVLAGLVTMLVGITLNLLPYDTQYLGLSLPQLCGLDGCRIVRFMSHDRVSFGGAVAAIGVLFIWLSRSPLRRGEAWAWWTLLVSGVIGFASFLTYLGFGYFDRWHATASIGLLVVYLPGMALSWFTLKHPRSLATVLRPGARAWLWSPAGMGRALLVLMGLGLAGAGLTIMAVGVTVVFVPQDLEFIGLAPAQLQAISPRLISVIAHDRANFGGGICATGIAFLAVSWCGLKPRAGAAWRALALAAGIGFLPTLAIHLVVGYTSVVHLAPVYAGGLIFAVGSYLLYEPVCRAEAATDRFADL